MKISRHSLFFKIFIGLWVTIMIFALTPLVFLLMNNKDHREVFYNLAKKELDKEIFFKLRTASETGDLNAMQKYINIAENRLNMDIFVFNAEHKEVFGSQYPENALKMINEMDDTKVVFVKKISDDPADSRVIRIFRTGKFIFAGYPKDDPPPSYTKIIAERHVNLLIYVFFLSLVASLILVRYFTKPLSVLSRAAEKISDGDFSVRVSEKLNRKDEIGILASDFDMMAEKLCINRENQECMLRDISHELRSPLTRLRLSLELARKKAGENATGALDRIETESERLNEMIGWLLEISRVKTSDFPIEKFYINDVTDEIIADGEFEATANGKILKCTMERNSAMEGNRQWIKSGLENIVRNAIRYSDHKVDINIARDEGCIRILVSDDGTGVDEKHLKNIFTPFYRVQDDRDRKTGGTGLGLSISKTCVEVHNGSIRAFNNKSGGLTIEMLLPEVREHAPNSGAKR